MSAPRPVPARWARVWRQWDALVDPAPTDPQLEARWIALAACAFPLAGLLGGFCWGLL